LKATDSKTTEGRLTWLDSLRLTAGVSMVGLHATSDSMGQPFAQYDQAERVLPMLLRAVIYTARTELFLVISIFLLLMALDKRPKSYGITIAVQSRRLLIPFAFWTVFYAFYNLIKAGAFGYQDAALQSLTSPVEWFGFFVLGSVKYHMHFIPTLFGLVLMFPLFVVAKRFPVLGLLVFVCLLIKRDLDGFVFSHFWGSEALPYLVRAVKIVTYAGYGIMAGAFLGVWEKTTGEWREKFVPLLLFFGGLLFSLKLVATWKTVETGAWPFDYAGGYYADFLMPVILFALAMALGHKKWPPVLTRLAPYSFGIDLCHPMFLDLVEIWLSERVLSPIMQVSLKITVALILTSALVWGLERTRILAWSVGLGPFPKITRNEKKREEEIRNARV
jgi:surface polysaccharide O-acyltransferase-like enzyme